jgi:hypothetical protein
MIQEFSDRYLVDKPLQVERLLLKAIPAPALSANKESIVYLDETDGKIKNSTNGSPFSNLFAFNAYKAADGAAVNNSEVVVPQTDLILPIGVGEVWQLLFTLWYSTSADLRLTLTGPALPTFVKFGFAAGASDDALADEVTLDGNGANLCTLFSAIIKNGSTAGNVGISMAQKAAAVSNTKLLKGSNLVANRIA